jgi:hypothetical protein
MTSILFGSHRVLYARLCSTCPEPLLDSCSNDACCRANPFCPRAYQSAIRPPVLTTRLHNVSRKQPHVHIVVRPTKAGRTYGLTLHIRRGCKPFKCGEDPLIINLPTDLVEYRSEPRISSTVTEMVL